MNKRIITALAGGLASLAVSIAPARAQDELTLCWAAWDPANALVELSKDFTAETGIGMKFEFVPWTNFADRFLNELNSGGKLCDPADRRQPVDRRLRRERPLREAQRFLRRAGDLHGRFPAGHRLRLLDLAEGLAQLLGAAGHGRCARMDLPQGLVLPPRAARGVQGEARPRARARRRPGPSSGKWPSSSRAGRSTARRSTAPRSTPSAAPRASPWA